MSKLSREKEKEQDLLEYMNDPEYVDRIMFSLFERSITIFFKNDCTVELKFDHDCRFDRVFLSNDLKEVFLNGVWLSDDEVDCAMLSFVFNILEGGLDNFVFYCEKLVSEFHKKRR